MHGDVKIDNMFFAPPPGSDTAESKKKKSLKKKGRKTQKKPSPSPISEDRIAFCDFQFVRKGLGATDLMYLLGKVYPSFYRVQKHSKSVLTRRVKRLESSVR